MKKEITVTAKTVELAIAKAVEELGAPSADAIQYTVVEEAKKGFLGIGATPAVIHATYGKNGTDIAIEFLEKLLEDMEIAAVVTATPRDDGETLLTVEGKNVGILIGHHGETLDSLQYLANLAANRKEEGEKREFTKITIDIENYRAKREETLRALARRMADKVVKYKKSIMLEPMNPYERRIIHSEVQNIKGVATNSIGSENNRKVVIYLEDNN
ncbi:MAG: protein jag [Ruminococcaceae bacterium]|nr:protein jag [Oscillospiraceae bacterium]